MCEVEISPAIMTDHKVVKMKLRLNSNRDNRRNVGYWKLNNQLLTSEQLISDINSLNEKF